MQMHLLVSVVVSAEEGGEGVAAAGAREEFREGVEPPPAEEVRKQLYLNSSRCRSY